MKMDANRISRQLTVGEVAARSGVAVSTLHFYEARGLIKSWRTGGNQRRYAREVLRRVAIIKVAQRTGIPLDTIGKALASLPNGRTPTAEDWTKLSAKWKADLCDEPTGSSNLGPGPSFASLSRGFRSGQIPSDRQPHPIQPSS